MNIDTTAVTDSLKNLAIGAGGVTVTEITHALPLTDIIHLISQAAIAIVTILGIIIPLFGKKKTLNDKINE